jgi:hypothetical protein
VVVRAHGTGALATRQAVRSALEQPAERFEALVPPRIVFLGETIDAAEAVPLRR